ELFAAVPEKCPVLLLDSALDHWLLSATIPAHLAAKDAFAGRSESLIATTRRARAARTAN
ncbi:MAG: hypothetical protein M3Z13_00815, partial [Candidatus Dormibacteraeota bacterium]|nr:hypothetical protein [Candidatus Dormibacteraeota bacterium]